MPYVWSILQPSRERSTVRFVIVNVVDLASRSIFFSDSMQRRRQNRPTDVRLDAWHAHRRTPFRAAVVALDIICADLLTYILQ